MDRSLFEKIVVSYAKSTIRSIVLFAIVCQRYTRAWRFICAGYKIGKIGATYIGGDIVASITLHAISVICYLKTMTTEIGGEVETLGIKPYITFQTTFPVSQGMTCRTHFARTRQLISLLTFFCYHCSCYTT